MLTLTAERTGLVKPLGLATGVYRGGPSGGGETSRKRVQSEDTPYPRVYHINPEGKTLDEAVQELISRQPDIAVVAYLMKAKCGFNGDDLIRKMMEVETQF